MNELVIDYNKETHQYEIVSENALENCQEFIKLYEQANLVISNDDDYKFLYKNRTIINNKVKEIKETRKQACKTITGNFEKSCKELEKELEQASNRITKRLEEYKPRETNEVYVLTIKTTKLSSFRKIMSFAEKMDEVEIKQEVK